jgi:hypothetical protein
MKKITATWRTAIGLVISGLIVAVLTSLAQNQPSLVITSPSSGSVFAPGQSIPVVVQAVGSFQLVTVFAQPPLQTDQGFAQPPYQFSVTIPTTASPGPYHIQAFGALAPGKGLKSQDVTVRVENSEPVVSLKTDLSQMIFQFAGEQLPILVTGIFSDGTSSDLSKSQGISYTSNNTAVAIVNGSGLTTATGGGNADIRVRYGSLFVDVPVSVPKTIKGDLNGDGKVDIDDKRMLQDALGMPAKQPVDARDLNGDGVINGLDVEMLVSLCTNRACKP